MPIGHRTLFIGVHVPLGGRKSHRRHRHRGHKHRKRDRERDSGLEDGRESPPFGKIIFWHRYFNNNHHYDYAYSVLLRLGHN